MLGKIKTHGRKCSSRAAKDRPRAPRVSTRQQRTEGLNFAVASSAAALSGPAGSSPPPPHHEPRSTAKENRTAQLPNPLPKERPAIQRATQARPSILALRAAVGCSRGRCCGRNHRSSRNGSGVEDTRREHAGPRSNLGLAATRSSSGKLPRRSGRYASMTAARRTSKGAGRYLSRRMAGGNVGVQNG